MNFAIGTASPTTRLCSFGALVLGLLLLQTLPASAALELRNAERYQLDNGLTVILLEDRNFPVVSVQMLYKVGARNEVSGKTGLAHFLEHMAFRATEKFPDTEVVSRIYAVGGEWHGYTWIDQTTYFATVPKAHAGLLLDIEAERMANLVIDPALIDAERGAVLAEMHMYENDPGAILLDALMYTSFLAHPYRNNTIGWESDIDSVTHKDVLDFYSAHYHPANAVLAVVGDFDRDALRAQVRKRFASLPGRPVTPLPHTEEPPQRGERRITVRGAAPGPRFLVGYRAPGAGHPDYAAFLVLQEILSGSSGVNFLQNDWGTPARETRLLHDAADTISTWFPPSADDYLFVIGGGGESPSGVPVERQVEERIAKLRETAPPADIVNNAVAAVLEELVYDVQSTEDAAHQLAFFEGLGAFEVLLTLPERLQHVTADDVARLARNWLQPEQRTIAFYEPAAPAAAAEAPAPAPINLALPKPATVDATPAGTAAVRRLSNGLPAIVLVSDLSPTVELKLVVHGTGLENAAFAPADPEPGTSALNETGLAGSLAALAGRAGSTLAAARFGTEHGAPQSLDPATRIREEFEVIMALPAAPAGQPPGAAVVVVAGDVDTEPAFAVLEAELGRFAPGSNLVPAPAEAPGGRKNIALGIPVAQSQLGYIVSAPAPGEPGYLPWRILQYIFAHDYEGRFGKEVISKRGLAYYVDAQYQSAGHRGWTTFAVGADTVKLDALEALLTAEIARLAAAPPTQAEIDAAKQHLLGRASSAAQTNAELTTTLARHWLYFASTPSVAALRADLDGVSRKDVLAAIPAFADGLVITVTP